MKSKSFARGFKRSVKNGGGSSGAAAVKPEESGDKFGRFCRGFLNLVTDIVCLVVKLLLGALVVVVIACGGIPISVVVISNVLGVGSNSVLTDIVFVFGLPALFVTLLWVVFAIRVFRYINVYVSKLFEGIKRIGRDKTERKIEV